MAPTDELLTASPAALELDESPVERHGGRNGAKSLRSNCSPSGAAVSINNSENNTTPVLLVVDADGATRDLLRQALCDTGITVATAESTAEGMEIISRLLPSLVVLDATISADEAVTTFRNIKRQHPRLPVLFITASGTSDTAIEALKAGAVDYLLKPLDMKRVGELVAQAIAIRGTINFPVILPGIGAGLDHEMDGMVGRSPQIVEVYKAIGRVAPQDVAVLIRGESGTGKELIARAIYQHSQRSQAPYLVVNCAAIPDALLESELFGHEQGAFTGADRQRIGKFEQCSGGTLFLDEVGDMSSIMQGKLLRVLQDQRFERIGGNRTIQTDVRIIAATHRDFEAMFSAGTFRPDLYFRLNGFTITVPPVRDRGDDIVLLLERIFKVYAGQLGKDVQGISPEALELLVEYSWPGNVREMQSAVRRALLHTSGLVLLVESLPDEIRFGFQTAAHRESASAQDGKLERLIDERLLANTGDAYAEIRKAMQICLLTRVLGATGGNRSEAAEILGISRSSLRHKLRAESIHIGNVIQMPDELEEDALAVASMTGSPAADTAVLSSF